MEYRDLDKLFGKDFTVRQLDIKQPDAIVEQPEDAQFYFKNDRNDIKPRKTNYKLRIDNMYYGNKQSGDTI